MPTSPTTLDSLGLPLGASAVDFQLKGVDGKTHSLKSFSAKKDGAICTPHVFAFDQQRRLQYKGRIDDNRNPESVKTKDLRDGLDAILAGHKPSVQETRPFGCSVKWKN